MTSGSVSRLTLCLAFVLALLGTNAACSGDDDDSGGGASGSSGSSAAGSNAAGSNAAGSNTAGSNTAGSAGSATGGTSGAAGSANGGSSAGGGGSGGAMTACTATASLASDIKSCNGYDTSSLSPQATYLQISSLALSSPVTAGKPLGISRRVSMGMPVVEYWGAMEECGPALQLLGTTHEAGLECVTTAPTMAYSYIISAIRDSDGFVSDVRVCDQAACP
jgi:hypothetical protein